MSFKVSLSPIAIKNIDNAVDFYIREANKTIALNFLKEFNEIYKTLE